MRHVNEEFTQVDGRCIADKRHQLVCAVVLFTLISRVNITALRKAEDSFFMMW